MILKPDTDIPKFFPNRYRYPGVYYQEYQDKNKYNRPPIPISFKEHSLNPMPLMIKNEHLFNTGLKYPGDIVRQFQGRIVLPLFKENNGFPPDSNTLG
jgi:hypothetical protein